MHIKIQKNLIMAHQPDKSLKESRRSGLVTNRWTLEIIIPKIKNVMLIQLCHKPFIHPSYQVQASLPLFYISRVFKTMCSKKQPDICDISVRDCQLACSYSLETTLQIIGLSKIEIMVSVLLLVPYPPKDPSEACQMAQPPIKLY